MRKKPKTNNIIPFHLYEKDALDATFNLGDLTGSIGNIPVSRNEILFLRRFNKKELMGVLEEVGLAQHLKNMGFDKLKISIYIDDSYINHFKIYSIEEKPANLLIDLRMSETKFIPDKDFFEDKSMNNIYDMLVIEWLSAQNPNSFKFSNNRPILPGQVKPGLGVLKYCFQMMYNVANDVFKDGFLDVPDHMHGAIMYSKNFKFFDPVHEGILRAMMRDLKVYSLSDITWGIITETIIDEYKNMPQKFEPAEQIFPVSERMKDYFNSKKYLSIYNNYYNKKKYRFDYDKMVLMRAKLLKEKDISDL